MECQVNVKSQSELDIGGRETCVLKNLSEVPIDSSHRAGEDDAAVVLLPHVGPGSLDCQEGAAEVGGVDRVPVLGGDPGKRLVPEDPGVGDHDVDLAPGLEGGGDQLVALLNRVVVGHGLATRILDLLDHDIRCLGVPPATISRGSKVIDNYLASSTGQEQSVGASQPFIKGRRSNTF